MQTCAFCWCFDAKYTVFGFTSIASFFSKTKHSSKVYVITFPEDAPVLNIIIKNVGWEDLIEVITPSEAFLQQLRKITNKAGYAGYLRLAIPELLQQYRNVVYLDADTLVQNDVSELLNFAKDNDTMFYAVSDKGYSNIESKNPYFNSGVLIMNLPVCRQKNFATTVINFISENRANLRWDFGDQEAIFKLYSELWSELPQSYNVLCKMENEMTTEQKEMVKQGIIVHFAGRAKQLAFGAVTGPQGNIWTSTFMALATKSELLHNLMIEYMRKHLEDLLAVLNPNSTPLIIEATKKQLEKYNRI